jgi:hypothetical protein
VETVVEDRLPDRRTGVHRCGRWQAGLSREQPGLLLPQRQWLEMAVRRAAGILARSTPAAPRPHPS